MNNSRYAVIALGAIAFFFAVALGATAFDLAFAVGAPCGALAAPPATSTISVSRYGRLWPRWSAASSLCRHDQPPRPPEAPLT